MRLFATVHHREILGVAVDVESGSVDRIPIRPTFLDPDITYGYPCRPFGITWSQDVLFVANNKQLLMFDREFQYIGAACEALQMDSRQLSCRKGSMWVTSPRTNSLIAFEIASGNMLEFDLIDLEMRDYAREAVRPSNDIHHFNSLLWVDGSLFVAAHNFAKPSFILEFTEPNLRLRKRFDHAGYSIHGLAFSDGELFWVSTMTQEIRSSRGRSIALRREGYAKGFAMTRDYMVVAISEARNRDRRHTGDAWIQLIERTTGQVAKELFLPRIGSINDLRVLDEYDLAHHVPPFLS